MMMLTHIRTREAVGYFDPSYDAAYEANCEEARKLLESAGYKFGDDGSAF